eukprot:CAMPEP_0184752648 /NCGR_PEP_ID=MMETSP0315-20130426/43690_1 /TAXON_ID=101924 /ORGANISM="Rhodosorus marinus, Strain UTEX LB 2760" /LENGTH=540 /DNA_ID=CAMNT_0027231991 /DNA_START=810 /DNA_END=2432 /DNA_ORIENTATION=-
MMPVKDLLRWGEDDIVRNTVELDMMSSSSEQSYPSNPASQLPISKHMLSTIFRHVLSDSDSKHVFVQNEQEDHFLYGLVLPLLARILCASCPGLLCIVEMPTAPDFGQEVGWKDKPVFSEVEAKALRLLSNGFEVLTSRLPPRADGRNDYKLATVGWVQAGVLSPSKREGSLPLTFSNGHKVNSDGIAITFANGSMCQLTIRDPWTSLEALKLPEEFPVTIFAFDYTARNGGYLGSDGKPNGSISHKEHAPLSNGKLAAVNRRNVLYIEIGHTLKKPSSTDVSAQAATSPWNLSGSKLPRTAVEGMARQWTSVNGRERSSLQAAVHSSRMEGHGAAYDVDHGEEAYHRRTHEMAQNGVDARSARSEEVEMNPGNHEPQFVGRQNGIYHPSMAHLHSQSHTVERLYHYPAFSTAGAPIRSTAHLPMNNMVPLYVNQNGYRSPLSSLPAQYQAPLHVQVGEVPESLHRTKQHNGSNGAGGLDSSHSGVEDSAGASEALVQMKYGRKHYERTGSNIAGSQPQRSETHPVVKAMAVEEQPYVQR